MEQKEDILVVSKGRIKNYKSLDYVCAWFIKGVDYCKLFNAEFAFVATNSIVQGVHVPILWPTLFESGLIIGFAHTSFKWKNNASNNAGVTCVIIGMRKDNQKTRIIFDGGEPKKALRINAYLLESSNVIVKSESKPINGLAAMIWGNKATDNSQLILNANEANQLLEEYPESKKFIRRLVGSQEVIKGIVRYCLWIDDDQIELANSIEPIKKRIDNVRIFRSISKAAETRPAANFAHRFRQIQAVAKKTSMVIPRVSSEKREYLPVELLSNGEIISDSAFAIYDAPIFNLAIIASKLHLLWISTVCGKLKTDFRYSNTLGWHTFPAPSFTEDDVKALKASAKKIIQAREVNAPRTIAQLYDPKKMPENLRQAHRENDGLLESLYRKKLFASDQERLEHLFERYSKMVQTKD